ncbi:hypothetical protein QBC35DRAFT_179154 [Podospora australis]|uniref:Uncharacterized protein n=1 Tax=Podospora australis TaxID=1536484 RepID=A0AAN7AK06_9PEZI|nr:hypothetical protein QBC35DRAFT_179154 [Podospora australis]
MDSSRQTPAELPPTKFERTRKRSEFPSSAFGRSKCLQKDSQSKCLLLLLHHHHLPRPLGRLWKGKSDHAVNVAAENKSATRSCLAATVHVETRNLDASTKAVPHNRYKRYFRLPRTTYSPPCPALYQRPHSSHRRFPLQPLPFSSHHQPTSGAVPLRRKALTAVLLEKFIGTLNCFINTQSPTKPALCRPRFQWSYQFKPPAMTRTTATLSPYPPAVQ